MLYLDTAATTVTRREVLEAMWPYLTGDFGNPSSHHTVGESAAGALKKARRQVASWLGCRATEVTFTSGGTEGDNLAIKGLALAAPRGRHVVTSRIEHEAVLESVDYLTRLHDFEVTFVDVDAAGRVTPEALTSALRSDTALVSIGLANNEVGTVQPIAELAEVARASGALFHTDAVQAAGWLDTNVRTLGVDALTVAGHKLGAPKGTGAVFIRGRLPVEPVLHGGGQEAGRRSGTENVAGAVGMAAAAQHAHEERERLAQASVTARDAFIDAVLGAVPSATLTGHRTERLPNLASFVFAGTSGESVLLQLEERGIVSSSGSACAAGSDEASHVLTALGFERELAQTAVRFSWGADTSADQLRAVAEAVAEAVSAVTALST